MKNKKVLALLISLVLIVAVALPGTLAVSSDQDAVNSGFTVDTASPAPETASPAPETQETTGGQEQAVAPETPAEVEGQQMLIYKHAVSTITPQRRIVFTNQEPAKEEE